MAANILPLQRAEEIIITDRLRGRPDRAPDLAREAAAFHELSAAIVHDPSSAIQRFLEIAVELCNADAAGLSLLDGDGPSARFRWDALVGCYAEAVGGTVPRDASPCGLARSSGHSILVSQPGQVFPEFAVIHPAISEGLVVPVYDNGDTFLGTIWVVHTARGKQFCANDMRVMEHLGIQLVLALKLMREHEGARAIRRYLEEARTDGLADAASLIEIRHDTIARENVSLHAETDALKLEIADLIEAGSFLSNILASSADCIKVLDLEGRIRFINEGGVRLLEAERAAALYNRIWPDMWPDAETELAWKAIAAAGTGEVSRFRGKGMTVKGTERFWDVQLAPLRVHGQPIELVLATARDITEQQRVEEQRELLAAELDHRVKNILAMVVAIAHQTLRGPATMEQASAAFVARLSALGEAQAILTRSSWNSANIRTVIEGALRPHSSGSNDQRFTLDGPPLELPPSKALSLALAIHELATNATKYGALSTEGGKVSIEWATDAGQERNELMLQWRESNGPTVNAPASRSFGSRLIERALAAEFRGKVRIDFDPRGVICTLSAPMRSIVHRKF